jgi:hypothetical protein
MRKHEKKAHLDPRPFVPREKREKKTDGGRSGAAQ